MTIDKPSRFIGSWKFILIQTIVLVTYLTYNLHVGESFDPYPFIFLNLLLSFQAAYTAPILMISQNRMSENDRMAVEEDRKNTKAMMIAIKKLEKKLLDKIDEIEED